MKASSISSKSIDSCFEQEGKSLFDSARDRMIALLNSLDHIGTSIALGEKGDLDAAHEFRIKGAVKNK